jgi:hypothetical protein
MLPYVPMQIHGLAKTLKPLVGELGLNVHSIEAASIIHRATYPLCTLGIPSTTYSSTALSSWQLFFPFLHMN